MDFQHDLRITKIVYLTVFCYLPPVFYFLISHPVLFPLIFSYFTSLCFLPSVSHSLFSTSCFLPLLSTTCLFISFLFPLVFSPLLSITCFPSPDFFHLFFISVLSLVSSSPCFALSFSFSPSVPFPSFLVFYLLFFTFCSFYNLFCHSFTPPLTLQNFLSCQTSNFY